MGNAKRCPVLWKAWPEFYALGSEELNIIRDAHQERLQHMKDTVQNVKNQIQSMRDAEPQQGLAQQGLDDNGVSGREDRPDEAHG